MRKITFLLLFCFSFFFLLLYPTAQTKAQKIYTIAGGKGNGCKLADGEVGFPAYMAFDKNNNIYATCIDNYIGAISVRKYDFQHDIVTTVAGNDTYSEYAGDGTPATQVSLSSNYESPSTIALDNNGNLFITEQFQNSIRMVDRKGIITTAAGTGIAGFSGDGGLAKYAQLRRPTDIALDSKGNLYIADVLNRRIRKIDSKGIITTIAGNGSEEYNGESIPAKEAGMVPEWITIDKQDNIYVYDYNNYRIRKIDTSGIIHNFAGNGTTSNVYPPDTSIASHTSIDYVKNILVDNKNNLYFIESFNVYKVSSRGLMTRFAGGGSEYTYINGIPATSVSLSEPEDLAVDNLGNIYISATYYITKVDSNNILHTVLGYYNSLTGSPLKEVASVGKVAINHYNDSMYVFQNYQLYSVDRKKGVFDLKAGRVPYENTGDSGLAVNASFRYISNVCFDKNGNTFIADEYANVIRKIDKNGIIYTVAGNGIRGFGGDGRLATKARLNYPTGVATDSAGNLYIADYNNNRIRKVNAKTQAITTIAGNGNQWFYGDGGPATTASLFYPYDLAFDAAENLYIADSHNRRIRKIDKQGIISTVAGNGNVIFAGSGIATEKSIGNPVDIAFDKEDNLYICDENNGHIYKVDANKMLTRIAGNVKGSVADGILPINAYLGRPERIALDATQNLYISNGYLKEIYTSCNDESAAKQHTFVLKYVNKSETLQDGCNIVCTIAPQFDVVNGLNSLLSSEVWITDSVIKSGNNIFAQRHYQLWSTVRPLTAKSTITLYCTQAEFDAYDSVAASAYTFLPKGRNDTANIKHLRIVHYNDTLANQNQLPPFSANNTETLNPADENIIWNDTLNCWQVTVGVAGLGNFYLTSTAQTQTTVIAEVAKQLADNSLYVYPNPAHELITIQVPGKLLHSDVQLIAQDGKIVYSKKINNSVSQLSLKNLASGLYILRFSDGSIRKVVKE